MQPSNSDLDALSTTAGATHTDPSRVKPSQTGPALTGSIEFEANPKHVAATASSEAISFRSGQADVFKSLLDFFDSSRRSTYVKLPGSVGKTFIYIQLIRQRKEPTLVLFPSKELMRQAKREFAAFAPELTVGFLKSGGKLPNTDVILGTIQRCIPLHKAGKLAPILPPLVVVDEAHELLGKVRRK